MNALFAKIVRKEMKECLSELRQANWCVGRGGKSENDKSKRHESAGHRTLRIFAWLCAPAYSPLIPILGFASSRICFGGQLIQEGEERRRLADEKSHVRQELDHAHGDPVVSRSDE